MQANKYIKPQLLPRYAILTNSQCHCLAECSFIHRPYIATLCLLQGGLCSGSSRRITALHGDEVEWRLAVAMERHYFRRVRLVGGCYKKWSSSRPSVPWRPSAFHHLVRGIQEEHRTYLQCRIKEFVTHTSTKHTFCYILFVPSDTYIFGPPVYPSMYFV